MTRQTQISHPRPRYRTGKPWRQCPAFLSGRVSRTWDHTMQSQSRNAYKVCLGGRCSVSLEQAHSVPFWDARITGFRVVTDPHFRSVWHWSGSTPTPSTPNVICFSLRFKVARKKTRNHLTSQRVDLHCCEEKTVIHSARCRGVVCCIVWPWKHVATFSGIFL